MCLNSTIFKIELSKKEISINWFLCLQHQCINCYNNLYMGVTEEYKGTDQKLGKTLCMINHCHCYR